MDRATAAEPRGARRRSRKSTKVESRAPLLETISTLSSLTYSDRSSSPSSRSSSSSSASPPGTESPSDLSKWDQDKPPQEVKACDQDLLVARSSRVRFAGTDAVTHSNSSTSTLNSVPETNNNHQQPAAQPSSATKSILKDPLCAKLRSWVGGSHHQKTPVLTKPSPVVVDASQLESEIDQLLYGPCLSNDLAATVGGHHGDASHSSPAAIDLGPASSHRPLRRGPPPSTTALATTAKLPFQTYIQMIEEKYRMQQSQDPKPKPTGVGHKSKRTTPSGKSNVLSYAQLHPHQPAVVNPPRAQHASLEQWLATLAQESSPTKSKPTPSSDSSKAAAVTDGQEELYSLLSDPVNGPPINTLMDQLSKSFGVTIGDSQQPGTIRSPVPSLSSRSSCSTGRSRSLAENHIYEEILYECLQQQIHGAD